MGQTHGGWGEKSSCWFLGRPRAGSSPRRGAAPVGAPDSAWGEEEVVSLEELWGSHCLERGCVQECEGELGVWRGAGEGDGAQLRSTEPDRSRPLPSPLSAESGVRGSFGAGGGKQRYVGAQEPREKGCGRRIRERGNRRWWGKASRGTALNLQCISVFPGLGGLALAPSSERG